MPKVDGPKAAICRVQPALSMEGGTRGLTISIVLIRRRYGLMARCLSTVRSGRPPGWSFGFEFTPFRQREPLLGGSAPEVIGSDPVRDKGRGLLPRAASPREDGRAFSDNNRLVR